MPALLLSRKRARDLLTVSESASAAAFQLPMLAAKSDAEAQRIVERIPTTTPEPAPK